MTGQAFRVGDAERDAAVSALGEHFAAGRLTKDEFDERSGRAWSARFAGELDELFTDLPQPVAVRTEAWPRSSGPASSRPARLRGPRSVPRMLLTLPLAILAVGGLLFLIVATVPWLLFVFGVLFLFGGPGRRRHWNWHDGGARPGWGPQTRDARPGWGPPSRGPWGGSRGPWGSSRSEWRQAAGAGWGAGRP